MNVKHVHEDAYLLCRTFQKIVLYDIVNPYDFAVCRRYHCFRTIRKLTLRIPEEPGNKASGDKEYRRRPDYTENGKNQSENTKWYDEGKTFTDYDTVMIHLLYRTTLIIP
jgi:hypothetical protein